MTYLYNRISQSNEKDRLIIYSTTWRNFTDVMSSKKKNKHKNSTLYVIPFMQCSKIQTYLRVIKFRIVLDMHLWWGCVRKTWWIPEIIISIWVEAVIWMVFYEKDIDLYRLKICILYILHWALSPAQNIIITTCSRTQSSFLFVGSRKGALGCKTGWRGETECDLGV